MRIRIAMILALGAILAVAPAARAAGDKTGTALTLEDCIARAVRHNLNVAVEVVGPELAAASLARTREKYLPQLDLRFNGDSQEQPSYWFLQGEETIVSRLNTYGFSVVQQVPMGGQASLSLQSYMSDTNQAYQLINPRYGSTLRFDFNQPLLRNFGAAASRREILVARNNLDISESRFKTVLADTIYQVQEAYWNLVYAADNLAVRRQTLELARDLLAKNRREAEIGTLAPIEVLNAETVVAQREADIIQAEAMVSRAEDVLKALINLGGDGGAEETQVVPTDRPVFRETKVSTEDILAGALAGRPELESSRAGLANSQVNFGFARNQLLPRLDFTLSYWSPGISGDRILYAGDNPFLGIIIGKEKGSAADSIRDAFRFLYENWTLGLTLSVPVADLVSRANYATAKLDLEQSRAGLKAQEQQIELEVRDAVRSVETDAKRVAAYRMARELAEKRLEAENKKLGVGLSTNYFVLQFQEEAANARAMEIKALVDYNLSLARIDKVSGRSLTAHNITLMR
jgi:outer membrane protein TolC